MHTHTHTHVYLTGAAVRTRARSLFLAARSWNMPVHVLQPTIQESELADPPGDTLHIYTRKRSAVTARATVRHSTRSDRSVPDKQSAVSSKTQFSAIALDSGEFRNFIQLRIEFCTIQLDRLYTLIRFFFK